MTLEQLAKKLNYWGALYGVDAELYGKLRRKAKKSLIATRIDHENKQTKVGKAQAVRQVQSTTKTPLCNLSKT